MKELKDFKGVTTINVAKDFSEMPIGRYAATDGDSSAEGLRAMLLIELSKVIDSDYGVVLDFDGVMGAGGSFLEELMGGLLRSGKISYDEIKTHLVIKCDSDKCIVDDCWEFLDHEQYRQQTEPTRHEVEQYESPEIKMIFKQLSKAEKKKERELKKLRSWIMKCIADNNFNGYAYAKNRMVSIMSNGLTPPMNDSDLIESWNKTQEMINTQL